MKPYTMQELEAWEAEALAHGMSRPESRLVLTVKELERLRPLLEKTRQLERRVVALEIHLKRSLKICEQRTCERENCKCRGWHSRDTEAVKTLLKG